MLYESIRSREKIYFESIETFMRDAVICYISINYHRQSTLMWSSTFQVKFLCWSANYQRIKYFYVCSLKKFIKTYTIDWMLRSGSLKLFALLKTQQKPSSVGRNEKYSMQDFLACPWNTQSRIFLKQIM